MHCDTCGQALKTETRWCATCGSVGLQLTITPRQILEFGVIASIVFGLAGAILVLLGATACSGVWWLGANIGTMLLAAGWVFVGATVPLLFVTSLAALRMLERVVYTPPVALASTPAVGEVGGDDADGNVYALSPPASVVEHTTLRLVVPEMSTEKVPTHG